MNPRLAFTLAWMGCACIALLMAIHPSAESVLAGQYIPVGNDSFYQARRILDMVADPGSLHQFDPKVHVPEGSMLIWPWGYAWIMSVLTRVGVALTGAAPFTVLTHLPALGFPLAVWLTAVICRRIGLGLAATVVAMLTLAFLPLNLGLYSLGNVDHHFAEQLMVLASLACGLGWLANPGSRLRAAGTAMLLGLAPCIHNGLFVLQIPLLAALGLQWLRDAPPPRTTPLFAATLVAATLVAALPSASLRNGSFEFYTLSWFHVYFAVCAAGATLFLAYVGRSPRNLVLLALLLLAALVPVTRQLLLVDRFMSVQVLGAQDISEVQSLWQLWQARGSIRALTGLYSFFVVLLPATVILCALETWWERDAARRYFWLASLAGLLMMASMVRMHVFGSFALLLPWLAWLEQRLAAGKLPATAARGAWAVAALAAVGGAAPGWGAMKIAGNDPYYALTADLYAPLAELCRRDPGVVLSSPDDANYVRYHTDCPVIANNFLLTPQHEAKIREVRELMALSPEQLAATAPQVRYVFVHRMALFTLAEGRMRFMPGGDPQSPDPLLVRSLIEADPHALPAHYVLVQELAFEKPAHVPYARLFAIEPGPGR